VGIELVFETHSTTEDNEQGRATGWLPGRLSDRGRLQATPGAVAAGCPRLSTASSLAAMIGLGVYPAGTGI
jgi:hypothetical protein